MLFGIALVFFVIVCIALVLLVIIQSDKGGGISGAIGGGLSGANSFLGTQDTANILTRGTTMFAVLYMVLCIVLSLGLSGSGKAPESALKKRAETQQSYSPASALEGSLPMRQESGSVETTPETDAGRPEGQSDVPEGEGAMPMLPQGGGESGGE
ncbi:MAG: preprotein translocase subunit SecG [Chitinivibrionales bacterium]|nr:preprotein translocase subunit SecG [Chitinivibrionales bacterium]MBD3356123.1 preprotein translocase subunit SecG [Chitinivibrionales bacterium]